MKKRPAYTAVVSTAALVVALSGTAVAGGLVTGKQIKNGTVTGKDVKNGSLAAADLRAGVIPVVPAPDPKAGAGAEIATNSTGALETGAVSCLPLRTEVHDPFDMHAPETDHLDVAATGTYLVVGTLAVDAADAKQMQVRITVDQAVVARTVHIDEAEFEVLTATALVRLEAGDDVCLGSLTSGGTAEVVDLADAPNATLTLQRVAP